MGQFSTMGRRYQKAGGSTRAITAKYNELFKELVTDQYGFAFKAFLVA